MLSGRLEHQKIRKNSHSGNLNTSRRTFLVDNHINVRNHSIWDPIERKIILIEDSLLQACTKMLKKIEKLRDMIDFSLEKKLWQLIYDRREKNCPVSHFLLVNGISGNFFHFLTQLPDKHNHITFNPSLLIFFSKPPKIVFIPSQISKYHHLPSLPKSFLLLHYTMKFKSNVTPFKRTTSSQQNTDISTHKRVEPLTTVPPIPTKRKTASKSATKKEKPTKKSEPKNAQVEGSVHDVKKTKGKEALKDSSDVSTHAETKSTTDLEKGKSVVTLTHNVSDPSRKLWLEDLTNAIDSTENMDVDTGNETNVNHSIDKDPDVGKDVGPDVETSLGQLSIFVDVTATGDDNKDLSCETAS